MMLGRARLWLIAGLITVLQAHLFAAATPQKKASPSVILVTIDTLRADRVGCYGAADIKTPTIDGLAHDGIVFERAIAQVPLTWPSHAAILTGLYPFQNGAQDFTGQPLDPRFQSIAQAFQRNGYATGAVVSSFALDRSWGLSRGFDFYDDAFSQKSYTDPELGLVERRANESVDHAIAWLKKNNRKPFFLWLHLYDPHRPYDPPEPMATEYRGRLYDGEIAYADRELGRLIAWLKAAGLYNRSLIALLSDHGESLGEHGEREHGFFVYDATIRVPLVLKPPSGSNLKPTRVARPVETIDVAPTLLTLTGVKDPLQKQLRGTGLMAEGDTESGAYSETFYPFNSFGWSPLHSLESGRYHFIDAPQPELYDIVADPQEKNNLAAEQAATVAVLRDKLQARMRENLYTPSRGQTSNLAPDAAEKLRALGYVAYRSPVSAESLAAGLPDPKDKISDFNSILDALDAFHAGDLATGRRIVASVEEKNPKLFILQFYLGEAALAEQKYDDAVAAFTRCLDLNPNFEQAMTGLSRSLYFQGSFEDSKKWAQRALQLNPQNYKAWYVLGLIDGRSNRTMAIQDYERAIAIQGNFAPLHRDLGLLQFQEKNYLAAATHLAKAVDLGVRDAIVLNSLGISYSRTDRPEKAIECYKETLAINPGFAEAHLNLATAYERLGKKKAAEEEYAAACKLQEKFCR